MSPFSSMVDENNSERKNDEEKSVWDKFRNSIDIDIMEKPQKIFDDQVAHVREILNSGKDAISGELRNLKSIVPTFANESLSVCAPFLWAGKLSREFTSQYPYIAGLCRRHPEVTVGAPSLLVAIPSYFGI